MKKQKEIKSTLLKGVNTIMSVKKAEAIFGPSFLRFTQQQAAFFPNENDNLDLSVEPKLNFMAPVSL